MPMEGFNNRFGWEENPFPVSHTKTSSTQGDPPQTPDLSRLLNSSDPWLLSPGCFANPCPAAWIFSSRTAPYAGCPVPLLRAQSLQPLLHLPCADAAAAGPDSRSDMCCHVRAAQSCPAISRLLKLNPLCFHASCSVCILGCGKDSLSAYQTQLFCTWKAYLSIIFILSECAYSFLVGSAWAIFLTLLQAWGWP